MPQNREVTVYLLGLFGPPRVIAPQTEIYTIPTGRALGIAKNLQLSATGKPRRRRDELPALRTASIQKELMPAGSKASRQLGLDLHIAAFQLKHSPTRRAPEMVMMLFSGDLISLSFARQFHRHEPSFLCQRGEIAIHGRNA